METEFPAGRFDAIVSFTPFSISRDRRIRTSSVDLHNGYRPGGLLLFTVARYDDGPGYTEDDFFGETMYWSNFGPSTYKKFLAETGFHIKQEGIVGGGSGSIDAPEEVHPFFSPSKRGLVEAFC